MTLLFRTSGDLSGLYFSDRAIREPRLVRELVKFKVPLFSTPSFCRAGGFSVMPTAALMDLLRYVGKRRLLLLRPSALHHAGKLRQYGVNPAHGSPF